MRTCCFCHFVVDLYSINDSCAVVITVNDGKEKQNQKVYIHKECFDKAVQLYFYSTQQA